LGRACERVLDVLIPVIWMVVGLLLVVAIGTAR
jgi:hypothetical protein